MFGMVSDQLIDAFQDGMFLIDENKWNVRWYFFFLLHWLLHQISDEKLCGPVFLKCAGANRRTLGVETDIEREEEQICDATNTVFR